MAGVTDQPLPVAPPVGTHHSPGEAAYAAGGLIELAPITHIDALRDVIRNGHPILREVDQPDWGHVFSQTLDDQAGSTSSRIERFTTHTVALDRFRAVELARLATAVLSLALSTEDSTERVARLFESNVASSQAAGHAAGHDAGNDEANAFSSAPLATNASSDGPDMRAFCPRAEYILNTADETALSARVNSRLGNTRRLIGQAVTAYVGTPLLLRALLEGRLRFNRWEAVIRKFAWLPLTHLHALDEHIAGLDPRFSLHQFTRKVGEFVAGIAEKPVLAARVRRGRCTWTEDLPGGESVLCMKGPTPLIHAHRNEAEAIARAAVRGKISHLDITPVEKTVVSTDDTAAAARTGASPQAGTRGAHDAEESSGVTTPMAATDELPPLTSLSTDDERTVQQLTFDVLIGARPRTETVLEEIDTGSDTTTRYRVEIACPDEATVLRKHAVVVVTVPMTTLLGVDDRPGTIEGAPVPADMARMIASKSTVWYRMLTDPATGQVLDEVALKYEPDRATRIAVQGKWQSCTAPGCSRPALQCEIDHGIPFNHHHPEQGGRTEPANLHPLCKRHHQAKTEGKLRMRRTTPDEIEWLMPIGTTSTSVAPAVDDGGILSIASAPDESPERAEARRIIAERAVIDPVTQQRAADAVYAQVWDEFVAEQEAWDRRMAQRRLLREDFDDARKKLEDRVAKEREELAERQARVNRKAFETLLRDERITRDERLLAWERAQWERQKRARDERDRAGRADPGTRDRSRDGGSGVGGSSGGGSGPTMFKTIIPMRVEEFDLGSGTTVSMHSPIFPGPGFRTSQDRDNAELFSSESARSRAAEESFDPDGPNGKNGPDVRGYEIIDRQWRRASRATDSLAAAIYELEESRAGYVTIAFDPAELETQPRTPELLRLLRPSESTGRSGHGSGDTVEGSTADGADSGTEDGAQGSVRDHESPDRSGRGLTGDPDVPPPF